MAEIKTTTESKHEVAPRGRRQRHMLAPFSEFERMMEEMFKAWPGRRIQPLIELEEKVPSVDVVDEEDKVIVRAELPGVEKKDIGVSVSDQTVTIKGETKYEEKEEKGDYFRREISRGAYYRTIALPAEVDGSRAKATLKDGILELTLPKLEEAKRQSIKID